VLTLFSVFRPIVIISGLSVLLSACGAGQATDAPYFHLVQGAQLQLQEGYSAPRKFAGHVEAKQKVDLAFELPGTVLVVQVDEGDKVVAGQELMRLDIRLLEDERAQLLAMQEEVAARQALVKLELKRQQLLQQKGLAAQQRRDELDAQAAVFAAQFSQQQSRLSAVAVRISKSVIKAPYDAYISARYFDAGVVVNSGQPVLQLLEQGSLEARVGVPAKLAQSLERVVMEASGQAIEAYAPVTVSLPDHTNISASIIGIGRAIDPITRTVSVRLALPERLKVVDGDLLFLNVEEQYLQPGFWVPISALNGSVRGMWNVMVLVPTGNAVAPDNQALFELQPRSVELLHRGDGKVFIRGGVAQGEQYVASGLHTVVAGQLVRVHQAREVATASTGGD
jgi:membrane fusion protein, multidrug efflux system